MTTTEVRETEFSQNCFEVLVKAQEQNNTLLTYATNMKVRREPLPRTS